MFYKILSGILISIPFSNTCKAMYSYHNMHYCDCHFSNSIIEQYRYENNQIPCRQQQLQIRNDEYNKLLSYKCENLLQQNDILKKLNKIMENNYNQLLQKYNSQHEVINQLKKILDKASTKNSNKEKSKLLEFIKNRIIQEIIDYLISLLFNKLLG